MSSQDVIINSILFLHGEDAIYAYESVRDVIDATWLWDHMLERDYPGITYDRYGVDPFEQYKTITMIVDELARYDIDSDIYLYDKVDLNLGVYIDTMSYLMDMMRDTGGDIHDVLRHVDTLTPEEIDNLQTVYDVMHDKYMKIVEGYHLGVDSPHFIYARELLGAGAAYGMINYMIANGPDAYDPASRDSLAYTSFYETEGPAFLSDSHDSFRFKDLNEIDY